MGEWEKRHGFCLKREGLLQKQRQPLNNLHLAIMQKCWNNNLKCFCSFIVWPVYIGEKGELKKKKRERQKFRETCGPLWLQTRELWILNVIVTCCCRSTPSPSNSVRLLIHSALLKLDGNEKMITSCRISRVQRLQLPSSQVTHYDNHSSPPPPKQKPPSSCFYFYFF